MATWSAGFELELGLAAPIADQLDVLVRVAVRQVVGGQGRHLEQELRELGGQPTACLRQFLNACLHRPRVLAQRRDVLAMLVRGGDGTGIRRQSRWSLPGRRSRVIRAEGVSTKALRCKEMTTLAAAVIGTRPPNL
jgi:hypothetical protein